jgi:hypothetical protein
MYLGGRMTVKRIVSRSEAVQLWNNPNLFDATDWIVDPEETGTLLNLHRRLSPALTKQLRFKSKAGQREPVFVTETELDNQAIRGVRELTPESAALLDRIIEVTDRLPRSEKPLLATEELLRSGTIPEAIQEVRLPEEVPSGSVYSEGSVQRILVNRYERDPNARKACIQHYGTKCCLCGFDFVAVYGELMAGFIHVHHLASLATVGDDYQVDPIRDLRPVCPNCHAVLHRREPPYSLEDIIALLQVSHPMEE